MDSTPSKTTTTTAAEQKGASSLELGKRERRTVRKLAGLRELGLDLLHAPVAFKLSPPVVFATPFVFPSQVTTTTQRGASPNQNDQSSMINIFYPHTKIRPCAQQQICQVRKYVRVPFFTLLVAEEATPLHTPSPGSA